MNNSKELKECLCCGGANLTEILNLGVQPLANSFVNDTTLAELKFPLVLNRCSECGHLQISHAVNPDLLFKNYLYVSGTSQTLREYFDRFAKESINYFARMPKSVLDIACNDGTQLNSFKALGLKTYGIDPATNLYETSSKNHTVICDYFKQEYVDHFKNRIDIINAQNVFAHTAAPLEFLQQCRDIMHNQSLLFIQTSQADMVRNNEFDTIYHEHLSFFCANSMNELARRAGLHLIDIRKTPIHGVSYLFVFSKLPKKTTTVNTMIEEEKHIGLMDPDTYVQYANNCKQVVNDLNNVIEQYRNQGYKIIGYGAAAKGMTLLNYGNVYLDVVIDDNPLKQGLFCPGTHIPVVSADALAEIKEQSVAFVPLAWNFFTEIRRKIKTIRNKPGDVFIKYFPTITIE